VSIKLNLDILSIRIEVFYELRKISLSDQLGTDLVRVKNRNYLCFVADIDSVVLNLFVARLIRFF